MRLRGANDRLSLGTRPRQERQPLTARQREVLSMLARGCSTKQVASALGISPAAVWNHVVYAQARLRAANRDQAIAIAITAGEIAAPPDRLPELLEPLFEDLEPLRGSSGQRFFPTKAARNALRAALVESSPFATG